MRATCIDVDLGYCCRVLAATLVDNMLPSIVVRIV